MIVVIQRVANASVKVKDKMVSSISNGMLILLGISNIAFDSSNIFKLVWVWVWAPIIING